MNYGISNNYGQTSKLEVSKILDFAFENKITFIDTAQSYGESENIIGHYNDDRFNIITKINSSSILRGNTKKNINQSLKRLQAKSIYAVLFHDAECALNNSTTFKELLDLKEEGLLKKIGFSVYTPKELELIISKYGIPDIIQIPFNHLDRRFESNLIELKSKGVEIHARSVFLQGLYFMNPNDLSNHFKEIKPYLSLIKNKMPNNNLISGFLLNYVVSKSFIDKVIIGVNSLHQFRNNLRSLNKHFLINEIEIPNASEQILIPSLWPEN